MHPDFIQQMQAQLGDAFSEFAAALVQPAPVSIRANLHKWAGPAQHDGQVPWCEDGYYLAERPLFTLDPLLHAGAYYVQEASSMGIAMALRQLVDLDKPLLALDLAAAPGGKSTLLAGMLSPDSLLIANEVIRTRYQALRHNLARWGLPNVAVCQHDPEDFAPLSGSFDLVLVDAPCSGEGLFRKDPHAQKEWSPAQVGFCAARQRRILAQAAALTAPGGVLIYSTCTYNDEENAANAAWLQEVAGLEYVPLDWPPEYGVETRRWGHQFYPHRVRGEGFFMACFRKGDGGRLAVGGKQLAGGGRRLAVGAKRNPDDVRNREGGGRLAVGSWQLVGGSGRAVLEPWLEHGGEFVFWQNAHGGLWALPRAVEGYFTEAAGVLRRMEPILEMGELKGGDLIPAGALALSTALSKEMPAVQLELEQAIRFLRKEDPQLPTAPKGWLAAQYEGHTLGWVKGLGNRVNNYFPKEWRILGRF